MTTSVNIPVLVHPGVDNSLSILYTVFIIPNDSRTFCSRSVLSLMIANQWTAGSNSARYASDYFVNYIGDILYNNYVIQCQGSPQTRQRLRYSLVGE